MLASKEGETFPHTNSKYNCKKTLNAYQKLELIYKNWIFKQTVWLLIQKSDFFSTNYLVL